jgi:protein-S-isoprenylcysteine O-methyltransferase Ste14
MATSRFFDWFQFGILLCWGALGLTRAVLFRARGVRVIARDQQRTFWELLVDGLASMCLLIWAYEVVAHAWPFGFHVGPTSFSRILLDSLAIKVGGAIVVSIAVVLYAVALRHLGVSWRLGIDRASPGPLVTEGIYRWTRHPIYVAFDLMFVGTFFVHGHMLFLLLALVWIPLLHVFMRREERFLTQLYGSAYRDYCGRVGRYFSWPKYDREPNAA